MQRAGIIVDRQKARACAVAVADWPHQPLAYGLMFERGLCNGAVNRIHSHAALVRIDNRSEVLGRLRSCDGAVGRIHSPSGAVAQSGAVGGRTGAVVRIHNCSGDLVRIHTKVLVRVDIHTRRVNRSRLRALRARLLD